MNKVATINLNGRAYQVEETGYDALRNYLDRAAEKLKDDPDKAEIMSDFEQAVADKCDARLS
ncbi:MAG: PspC domain-containing protein, partial [Candidatus Pacebacteria bacterium]|nr:PspC domain-containing protein [Candidatus Paceibacterota bacterium]